MDRMTSATLKTLLRVLPELYQPNTLDRLPGHLLQLVAQLVPSEISAYNEVSFKPSCVRCNSHPVDLGSSAYLKPLEMFIDQHPVVRHQRRTRDLSAHKISDFLSRERFHRTPLYNEVYRHLAGEDQMAVGLELAGKAIVALALNRSRRSFNEEEREALNFLQPHLIQTYRNACALTALEQQLASSRNLLENLPVPLVVLDGRLHVKTCTPAAQELLARYFEHASTRALPEPLRLWLVEKRQWLGKPLPTPIADFRKVRGSGTLTVRFAGSGPGGETVLALEERTSPQSAQALRALGLTARESEILLWVARGKSNPEIAVILGMAPRTVQKHLEHVFEKLEVTTRTDAARRALEVFSPGLLGI